MTTISVGLPVFNGEKLVAQAIESILQQTHRDLELIICDNASTDSTEKICRSFAASDRRVKYHRHAENIGAAANFRYAFELAGSEYFRWICVDDLIAPTLLAKTKAALDERPDVVLCCSKVDFIDGHGNHLRHYADNQALSDDSPAVRFKQCLAQDSWVNAVYGLIRAEALRKTSVMGSFTGSDVVLVCELSLYGKFFELPERLFFRRIHEDAFSYDCAEEKWQEFYNPGENKRSLLLYRWRHLFEHYRSIRRAPVEWAHRRQLFMYLLRTVSWHRRELIQELGTMVTGRR